MALGLTPEQIIEKNEHPLLKINSSWRRTSIETIAIIQNGYAFSSSCFTKNEGMPLIRIRDISSGKTENYYKGDFSAEFVVKHGDILVGMDGDFNASVWSGPDGLLNQRVCRVIPTSQNYNDKFLFLCLQPYLNAINEETSSVTVKHLSSNTIKKIPLPLPPLPEQRAIVSKIEQLFSDLDNGIANLKLAQGQLKVYRQAVLKKAFEGELTKTWRLKNLHLEDSKEILDRIKNQVSTQYQNKKSVNNQYDELLYELPLKWNWTSLSNISVSITDGDHQAPPKSESGVPFIVISNISSGKLNLSKTMHVPESYYNNLAVHRKPQPQDILYSVTGSYGIPILISENSRFCFQRHIALIRPHSEMSSKYIYYFLKSLFAYDQATKVATGTAQLTVPLSGLRIIKIPFPPLPEQHAIVNEIETRLSVCDKLEQDIAENLEKAEALRQSILKRAFEGKLLSGRELEEVRNAPDWEPAEKLLERIKAQKASGK